MGAMERAGVALEPKPVTQMDIVCPLQVVAVAH